ncbi:bifunctional indole-3-glycerol-phosphate synthase TrpC/phosphoribosylanthranilate isomerase TrpF [Corynebacterium aurimucosum]|uniref:bifunctional indole-3-glycerol-phosphate synthase TrpC/phosphoribosylanthranilate isomerase TrpF n=1 Tax=Corynebacterium TaxID=1716 RepID=UPI0008A313EA|nr:MULTISPECIES: bifunctional indole-3-glycerol-phosphate synthase TrpC/phosphoribosylanthranilate isomerase TrpF [Corynebacterium]MCG7261311.1 bifunctional indole-3-glycerol-phosphate synthase TrpC/phosphoribosylanthranilate isomerase TrpF [Corynebacterium aurimucosum]MTE10310.1 bifunctional indole-3-glycerol-phosphate synthase TrpC/phosphoribosylanthranilate isomerase TrpF [Corynebacterium guaraldiae]OFK93101.1 bifunctional indole-3-glycerol phosphate synthase/phosphoribosylanthranilate isomer
MALPTVLEGIVAKRRTHLPAIRERLAHVDLTTLPRSERSFYDALNGTNRFIMECKSASPSLGLIREHYEPGAIARVYSRYASAISVLCEPDRFGGDYDHLQTVALSTHLPVLCKDFIIDPIQVYAARYFGADAILLMMSSVDDETYAELKHLADSLGLDVLTEAITEDEVDRATAFGVDVIGINNRNLHDLSIDLTRSERLSRFVPSGKVMVSESGIRNNQTVRRLGSHANAFLVGSQLTGTPDIDRAARELVYGHNKVCGLTAWSAAQAARAAGAVYGGLIFEEASPRSVSRETALDIIAHEPDLSYVAVSRRTTGWEELAFDGIAALQIHAPYQGSTEAELQLIESVRAVAGDRQIWRAIDMTAPHGPVLASALADASDMLILDAGAGGTGSSFDWSTIPDNVKDKALLAGGLKPENLRDALRVGTAGLDINSGVEVDGRKDTALIATAFNTIRHFTY